MRGLVSGACQTLGSDGLSKDLRLFFGPPGAFGHLNHLALSWRVLWAGFLSPMGPLATSQQPNTTKSSSQQGCGVLTTLIFRF